MYENAIQAHDFDSFNLCIKKCRKMICQIVSHGVVNDPDFLSKIDSRVVSKLSVAVNYANTPFHESKP